MKPATVYHRMDRNRGTGVYSCGLKERDGAKASTIFAFVNCPKCREITLEARRLAKLRSRLTTLVLRESDRRNRARRAALSGSGKENV